MSAVTQPGGYDAYTAAAETPVVDERETTQVNSANGADTIARQPTLSHVSPEEAESLPFDQLKARMREEARLIEEGVLPPPDGGSGAEGAADAAATTGNDAGGGSTPTPGESSAGTSQQSGTPSPREQQLEQALQAVYAQQQEAVRTAEAGRLQAQHAQAEATIAAMPPEQQADARRYYQSQLHQAQLNDYGRYLAEREGAIQQQEFKQAKSFFNESVDSLAAYVAERHGIAPDRLAAFAKSKESQALLEAATNPQALQVAAASIGQTMDWLAQQEAQQSATAKETRRANASGRVQRDVPAGAGNAVAGGQQDEIARINNMSRQEFFAYKAQKLREAQAAS